MSSGALSVLLTIVTLVRISSGEGDCPDTLPLYLSSTRTCYAIISNIRRNFSDAQAYCEALERPQGYSRPNLATVSNKDVQLKLQDSLSGTIAEKLYIGLQETFTDWIWQSTQQPVGAQGCYNLVSLTSDSLNLNRTDYITDVTNTKCQKSCKDAGYKYAGVYMLERTPQCQCGDKFTWDNENGIAGGGCTMSCPTDSNQKCGGSGKILVYRVADGTPVDLWHFGEPNNYDKYARCLTLVAWEARKWGDMKCGDSSGTGHICQYPLGKSECNSNGYYYHDASSTCFMPHRGSSLSWYEARADCMGRHGGDLIIIDTTELHSYVIDTSQIKNEGSLKPWWIGAKAEKWSWISNGKSLSAYSNWDVSNPSRSNGHCVVIHVNSGGGQSADISKRYKWEDNQCEESFNFICESVKPEATTTTTTTPTTTTSTTTTTTTTPSPSDSSAPGQTPQPIPSTAAPTLEPTPTPVPNTPTPTAGTGPGDVTQKPADDSSTADADPSSESSSIIFSNGVIVAIVIAGVAVLVATIRLLVYCCQRRTPRPNVYKADNRGFAYDTMESKSSPNSPLDKPLEDVEIGNDTYSRVTRPNSHGPPPDNNSASFGY